MPADLLIINANGITMDPHNPAAESVAVTGDIITAVGASDELKALAGPDTRILDAEGKTLLPGFIDAHCTPSPWPGSSSSTLTAPPARSIPSTGSSVS